ncbi:hypothetical protein [Acidovorax sp. M2(2025)]|uniref:hypothetical protein n=1 Tax=Acidovorax sp. M2(2025) TaxID=3411355 RepID=UPI003BF4EC06
MPPDCFPSHAATPAGPARGLLLAAALLLAGCSATAPRAAASPEPAPARTAEPAGTAAAPAAEPAAAPAPEPARPPAAPAPQAGTALDQVLAYSDRVLRLPPAELAREVARLGEAEDASPDTPLLLATALAQTRQPVDTARALGLVQRVLGSSTAPAQALHPLARLMEARLLQQRRLEDQLERQAQQLRDAQRRNDQLNERLEAVRAIERSLTTRPAALPSSPPAPAGSGPQRPAP